MGGRREPSWAAVRLDDARASIDRGLWDDAEITLSELLSPLRRERAFLLLSEAVGVLLEARRLRWSLAESARRMTIIDCLENVDDLQEAGCYLVQPPMIGAEGRRFRDGAIARGVAVRVITREPMTRVGRWPIVGVGDAKIVRTQVDPPPAVEPIDSGITRDLVHAPPPPAWFADAGEALAHAAMSKLEPGEPAAWRVDDLLDILDAHPEAEATHRALREACVEAHEQGEPERERVKEEEGPLWF